MTGETLETTPDGRMRLTLHLDEDPCNPREEYDRLDHMISVDESYVSDAKPGPLHNVWEHYRYTRDAVALFTRYAAWTGAVTLVWSPAREADRVFYLPAESLDEVGDPQAYLSASAEEYAAWADGNVWGYVIERCVTWRRDESDETMETWEHVDSCWGFYGHAYAEEAAREAWTDATGAGSAHQSSTLAGRELPGQL
jgi:hypothetical protein